MQQFWRHMAFGLQSAIVLLFSDSCAGSVGGAGDGAAAVDDSAVAELAAIADVPVVAADVPILPDVLVLDVPVAQPDVSKSDAGCTEAGCPCTENTQCDSAYCIEAVAGQQCAKLCTDKCDDGYKCAQITGTGGDISNLCVPAHPRACEPCAADSDCSNVLGGADSRCLVYKDLAGAALGNFCGNKCNVNSDCATGYSCKDVTSVGGVKGGQCVKDDLVCGCDGRATKLQLATTCTLVNSAGTCAGKRSCGATGLSACDAASAVPEQCNKKDDNCDGQTDEPSVGMCDDSESCSYDNCIAGECQHPPKPGVCDDKTACTTGDACNNGACVGKAVVCDDKNPCTIDSCDAIKGCVVATDDTAKCSDENVCTVNDTCKGSVCMAGAATVCDDNNLCTTDSCDGKAGCVFANNSVACSDGDVCTLGDTCKGGSCGNNGKLPCNDGNPCSDDSCDAIKGCVFVNNTAVCDDNNNCTTGDACKDGVCTPVAPSACDDGNGCTTETCDPKGGCKSTNNTASCSDDNVCTVNDACDGGKCAPGKAQVCNDGNGCTDDSCDAKLGCAFNNNVAACSDNNVCTEGDVCGAGSCQPGAFKLCDDNNLCTNDNCDAKKGCVTSFNAAPCSDKNICTENDTCKDGGCESGSAKVCDDGNGCTTDICDANKGCVVFSNGEPCSDNNLCTLGDTCSAGSCAPGSAKVCDDGKVCTTDSCDAKTGCIVNNNSVPCDDGSVCTLGDVCGGGDCAPGKAIGCDDGNPCTDDSCDKLTGCVHSNNNAGCSDNNNCTVGDTCKGGVCTPSGPSSCDDNNVCTTETCDPKTGACNAVNNAAACSDGSVCSNGDTCAGGKCVGGPAVNCDDGNPCTDDSCDNVTGCLHGKNTAGCNDGNVCTLNDVCSGGICTPGLAKGCDDGNICTDDTCAPISGCANANNKGACTDSNVCTGGDLCSAGSCVAGVKIPCSDGNVCTDDSCNAVTGCVFANNTAVCNDGNGCTQGDVCAAGACKGGIGCSINGQCASGPQAVSCACKPGYTGDGFTCGDVDECAKGIFTCPANEVCVNTVGSYVCECKNNFGDCNNNPVDGCEADFSSDINNCNSCAAACGKANGTPTCQGNKCSIACAAGFNDCDLKNVNGCEVKTLGTDVNNCGACSTVCSGSNISAACNNGVCNGACAANYTDCDGNKQKNGCEMLTGGNDVTNCGGCATKCSTSNIVQTCTGGACNGACNAGYSDCNSNKQSDGCEVQTGGNDLNNCGGCGTVCAGTCTNGVCAVSDPCVNYGGTQVTIGTHIKVCKTNVAWGGWNPANIPGGWTVCTKTQWDSFAPAGTPASYGLATIWINNNSCGSSQHHEIYVSFPMNQVSCYDGSSCCWPDTTALMFAVCL